MSPRIAVPLLLMTVALAACGEEEKTDAPTSGPVVTPDATCDYQAAGSAAKSADLPPTQPEVAESLVMTTNQGTITIELDAEAAPCTAGSFTSLAQQGYFDDTECHRLTTEGIFVLQCGDPSGTGGGGPGYQFADELSGDETYPAGTLAMANAGPNTNGSQFFIVYDDTPLPPLYTVFGTIDDAGLEVVRKVAEAGSDEANAPGDGAPLEQVVVESVK